MKIINQSHKILEISKNAAIGIERAARTCYKSESKITDDSAEKLVQTLYKSGHHAMLEFGFMTVKFITDRGVTHELVRHRLCSFAQESTRYVNYKTGVEFIRPVWVDKVILGEFVIIQKQARLVAGHDLFQGELIWVNSMIQSEQNYKELIENGWRPEQARSVLPNSLKTEIVIQANFREWIHIFSLRCNKTAHPQIRELMLSLLKEVQPKVPVIFDEIFEKYFHSAIGRF